MALIKVNEYKKNILLGERTDSILVELPETTKKSSLDKIQKLIERPIPQSKLIIPTKVVVGKNL